MVANGQLEFINGGWCMNDEAAVYYEDSIDQMTVGHKFLLENFGFIPTIGWHIDPFGHAAAQAALFAQMGFHAFFFARVDYQDKLNRLNDSSMEMIWQPATSQGMENSIFAHVNYYHYVDPRGFCYDIRCSDDPVLDDPSLEGYNLPQQADAYMAWFRQQAFSYRSPSLMHTVGTDFAYQAAQINFKNIGSLVDYINANSANYNANIQYSTPSVYLNEINKQNHTYPYKFDDFFPYSDEANAYWTGYHTSRVAMKGLTRKMGRIFQASKKLAWQLLWTKSSNFVLGNFSSVDTGIFDMETAMGSAQHHDAVTGTEAQQVVWDYEYFLGSGYQNMKDVSYYENF
jgi:hypothetical protein